VPSRPGVSVAIQELPTPAAISIDTGTWFTLGTTDRGPANTPTIIQSLDQFNTVFGARQSYSVLYDALELFFREGGARAYVSRVVGPAATVGTKNLLDGGAGISLVVNAIGPGAWSSSYKVGVVAGGAGGSYQIQISDASNNILEQSGDLLDQGSAVAWSAYSNYVRIVLGVTALNPAVAALVALSAGNDDRASITDTQWQTALDACAFGLGPGQVSEPGRITSTAYASLKNHAEANNRVALIDAPNSATVATLQASAASVVTRFGAMFAPWIVIPGLTAGTTRVVPPCALIAGLLSRNDPPLGTNMPAAGNNGIALYATDLSQPDWTDAQRTTLNTSEVNVIRRLFGSIRNYGWRALVNPTSDPSWVDFGNARLFCDIAAELDLVGENFVFAEIDGQNGSTINGFHASIAGQLQQHFNAGEFFGDTADQAYAVDTGPTVNTLASIAANELHAVARVRMSPFAEYVVINIVKRQVTQLV
jgi:phage tail sheath protein FI